MTVDTDKTMAAEGMVESREHASLARQQRHTTGEKKKNKQERRSTGTVLRREHRHELCYSNLTAAFKLAVVLASSIY